MQAEFRRMDFIFDTLKKYSGLPYEYLPEPVRAKCDPPLWEHIRWRYRKRAISTYFPSQERLREISDLLERAWNSGTPPLALIREQDGLGSFRLKWMDTEYIAQICVRPGPQCAQAGQVKTIHPYCGPGIRTFDLSTLETGYASARQALLRESVLRGSQLSPRQSSLPDLTPRDFGLVSVPCRR